jgi:folate-binding protein YgfZ
MNRPEIEKAFNPAPRQQHPGYTAARENCVFYPVPDSGVLQITGPDRSEFLQRQTTNDLKQLSAGHTLTTILTSATGRVLDVLTLLDLVAQAPETGVYLAITLPGKGVQTADFLQKKIFFMDKVTVENLSQDYRLITLEGPGIIRVLNKTGLLPAPGTSEVSAASIDGAPVWLFDRSVQSGAGVNVVAPAAMVEDLTARLTQAGAEALDTTTAEVLRVETGLAGVKGELNGDYTPLETNLDWAISSTKGCYTGQEVIARQITYDKVTRKLVGIKLAAKVKVGDPVWVEGKTVGAVTSFAISPRGGPLALAILKRPHHLPGTSVLVGDSASGHAGEVHALPFQLNS